MTTWNATTIAAGDYSALPTLPGVLVGQEYGFSEPGHPAPTGTVWVPIQRDDEAATFPSDYAAASAYARAVGSPVGPSDGVPSGEGLPEDTFVAVPIGATIDARGVVELPPSSSLATVCGSCGRGWLDEHTSDATPAPSGRCPFEYDHPDETDETDETDEEGTVAHAAANGCTGAIEEEGALLIVVHLGDPCPACGRRSGHDDGCTDDDAAACEGFGNLIAMGTPDDETERDDIDVDTLDEMRCAADRLAQIVGILEGDEGWSADTLDAIGNALIGSDYARTDDAGMFATTGRAERAAAPIR